jgi:hypothetical protein
MRGGASIFSLKAKRNSNLARTKSRVANYLTTPGQFQYTEKQAIQGKYNEAIAKLQTLEKPKETTSALRALSNSLEAGVKSQAARETGAVVITIPVGLAQLALKGIRLFLSILVVVFIDLPLGFMSGSPAVNLAAAVAPNRDFNTTARAYNKARNITGAKQTAMIQNYK